MIQWAFYVSFARAMPFSAMETTAKKIEWKVFELNSKMKRKSKSTILILGAFLTFFFFFRFELIDCGLSPLVCVIQFLIYSSLRLLFLISILDFIPTIGIRHLVFRALHRALHVNTISFTQRNFFLFSFGWVENIKIEFPFAHQEAIQCSMCSIIILWSKNASSFFLFSIWCWTDVHTENSNEIQIDFFSPVVPFFYNHNFNIVHRIPGPWGVLNVQ